MGNRRQAKVDREARRVRAAARRAEEERQARLVLGTYTQEDLDALEPPCID